MYSSKRSTEQLRRGLEDIALRRYETVHAQAVGLIAANVADAVPYCLLAMIAADHGNHVKARELFKRATELDSRNAWYHALYGRELTTLGYQNLAKAAADRAARIPIDDAFVADTIGVIYSRTGFHENAIPFFETAVALDASPANFHYNLAASQQFLGNFELAEAAYARTLDRNPQAYRAWSSLVALSDQTESHNHLDTLQELFGTLSGDADATLHLGHAIAKTLEDLGQYGESLDWLHKAKHLKRRERREKPIDYDVLCEAAGTTYPSAISNFENASHEAPIFIVGLPRSGTTLVDRILSSHREVTAAGELNLFPGLIKEAARTPSNMVMDVNTFAKANKLDLAKIGKAYIDSTKELARGAARTTDKMPLNFFYAGLIHRALPNARIIALRRGAMDSCLSNYRQLLTVQHFYYHYTYDLKDTAVFYRLFHEMMAHWRKHLPTDRFMEVRYEDIVHDQEKQSRKLLDFCGLSWDPACLSFHKNSAPVSTASSVQVRRPLYSDSIGRWQRYGNKLDVLREALGDLADS